MTGPAASHIFPLKGVGICYHKKKCGGAKQTKLIAKHTTFYKGNNSDSILSNSKCHALSAAPCCKVDMQKGAESCAEERGTSGGHFPESLDLLLGMSREG